jgi:hypothetical protein
MRIVEIRPSKRPRGWCAFEAPGVELAFPGPDGKQDAIDTPGTALAGVAARFTFTATTVQPSSAGSPSTVAANIHKAVVTENIHPRNGDFQS